MLKFWKASQSEEETHEELFMRRYERLYGQALRLTARDEQLAEDLVHEAYVQFTLARPDLRNIQNLDGYLYGMLRKLHMSHLRRASRLQYSSSFLVDYDSLELGLRAMDLGAQIRVQDELRLICHYACVRKESSKAGSVLLLRFFHGYYPSEIARILGGPRSAVDDWLRIARREAKLYINDPRSLSFMAGSAAADFPQSGFGQTTFDVLNGLRRAIFERRHGECFAHERLRKIYQASKPEAVDSPTLAQIVSCSGCLDQVNNLLGLPPLSERNPVDMLGPDPKSKGGGSGQGGTGSSMDDIEKRGGRRRRETFEHRPTELLFSVNGFILSSLKISSERCEQSQSISIDEKVSFVEVFSEQGVRLLFLDVEPPPDGPVVQTRQVSLSEGRQLDLSLCFSESWPSLHAVYLDPLMSAGVRRQESEVGEAQIETAEPFSPDAKIRPLRLLRGAYDRLRSRARLWSAGFRLRPATVTALISVILIAALVFVRWPVSPVSAAELLRKSAASEEAIAARTDQALRRAINLEERNVASGKLISRRKIEIWRSAEKGVTARRLFDEQNRLLAGEWKNADGSRMIYQQGAKIQAAPEKQSRALLTSGQLWLLEPSAKEFTELIGQVDAARVEEKGAAYIINFENEAAGKRQGLVKASLTVNKSDLRAIEQKLLVNVEADNPQSATGDPQLVEYRFTETSFERRPPNAVAPAVFEPDPALLMAEKKGGAAREKESVSITANMAAVASAELEIETLERLNHVNAFAGEQLSLTRTPEGTLLVSGIVETSQRKSEILRALESVANHPAVKVEVLTVTEAQSRQSPISPKNITIHEVEVAQRAIPVEVELSRYFSGAKGVSGQELDQEIKRLSNRVFSHSTRARSHALALKQIVERFSPADLEVMDSASRLRWRVMISGHAQSLRQELQRLRQELAPIFPASSTVAGATTIEITNDEALALAARRLFELASATDSALRQSFSLGTESMTEAPVKSSQFWRAFSGAESLAVKIADGQ